MSRNVTVTFADGAQHTYQGVPDGATPSEVQTRAEKQFAKTVKGIDGGAAPAVTAPAPAPAAPEAGAGRGFVNPPMDAPDGIPRMLPRQRATPKADATESFAQNVIPLAVAPLVGPAMAAGAPVQILRLDF